MTRTYAWTAASVVAVAGGVTFPWLDGPGRVGLLAAAALVLPVQIAAFALLSKHAARPVEGLVAWIGAAAVRMAVVIAAGVAVATLPALSPVATLIGCAGLFFVLLMLEPIFLEAERRRSREAA